MTDRLGEQGAIQYAQNNPTSAGVSRLGGAGALQAAIADALSNGRSSLNGSRLGGKGRIYALAAGAGPMFLFNNSEVGVWYDPSDFSTLFQDNLGATPVTAVGQTVGKILDKSGNGYHATQATSTARPILGRHPITGRRNLLRYTEDFSNAVWTRVGGAGVVTVNSLIAPDGTLTADEFNEDASNGSRSYSESGIPVSSGASITVSMHVRAVERTRCVLSASDTVAWRYAWFDLSTGTVGSTTGTLSGVFITPVGNGWYRIGFTLVSGGTSCTISISPTIADGVSYYQGVSGYGIGIWGAQLELGLTSTAYQKVVSTYDVTEAGVNDAYYSDGDGVDDSLTIPAGGGGSTGFFLCAAVRVDGGAGTNRVIYSDAGTNTGYILRLNASNQLELAAGNGTAYTLAPTTATLTAGPYVVTAWDDGTNLNVQVDSGAVDSVARPVVSAGNADFRIGKDYGAATGYFNGAIYPYVYVKNAQNVDANDRAAIKSYIASKAGVSI